jgi:antirestriction protein ArdC
MEQPATTAKRDVYAIVTERIIEKLERGVVPWRQPWHDAGLPQNLVTKRPYRGINVMLLASLGYERNFFLTSKQMSELGGVAKPNEKPQLVVYWNWQESKSNLNKEESNEEGGARKKVPFLRYYTVFNVAQCDGIPEALVPRATVRNDSPIPACEAIVSGMPKRPEILHKELRAFYNPVVDVVNLPRRPYFRSDESYYATLFHELVHSTGHPSRLNRKGLNEMSEFGSEPYSFEELVAEIGACYLESHAGIAKAEFEQNVSYIKGWLKKFKDDKRFVVEAAALAQKASDFVLHSTYDHPSRS